MRITESKLREVIRSVLKESLDANPGNVINVHGIKFQDLEVDTEYYDQYNEVGVEYKLNGVEYSHENGTGSHEGLAYAIMENLEELGLVDEESPVYEEIEDFLIDLLDDKIEKSRKGIE